MIYFYTFIIIIIKMSSLRRITSEIPKLRDNYDFEIQITKTTTNVILKIDSLHIRLKIPDDYPFRVPNIYVNNMDWCSFARFFNSEYQKKLLEFSSEKCFCCHSIIQSWAPNLCLQNVIDEIIRVNNVKIKTVCCIILSVDQDIINNIVSYI